MASLPRQWFHVSKFTDKAALKELELLCTACNNVMCRATLTPCQHLFCSTCIQQLVRKHGWCSCRQGVKLRSLRPAAHLDRLVAKQTVRCSSGCSWTGPLAALAAHARTCEHNSGA